MRASHLNKALVFRRSMKPWVRFENVEVMRDGYYVSYSPKFISAENDDSTAILSVRLLREHSLKQCKEIAEFEFEYWIKRYPVPLQTLVKFECETTLRLSKIADCPYICGVSESEYRWGGFLDNELEIHMPSNNELKLIYSELPSKTSEEVDVLLNQELRGRRILKWFVLFIAVIIPALIALLGWSHPLFSALALIFAWYKCADKWLSLSGRKLKTDAELAAEEDERLKEHHHDHCKLNPEGFERLKLENFKVNRKERLHKKLESMPSAEIEN
ncbi:hypothetical protein KI701_23285 [Vibrio sp. D415a]|nr:hypothetical protein [Vibrio sp. D415a]MDK9747697.1 hypothetical protein [Vibrio sp. D409a]MDK9769700.1 hypothetical protein [Vibrio sp. D417a]MDK9785573.1 hypothetical protein [Vibrio sp. D421a]